MRLGSVCVDCPFNQQWTPSGLHFGSQVMKLLLLVVIKWRKVQLPLLSWRADHRRHIFRR